MVTRTEYRLRRQTNQIRPDYKEKSSEICYCDISQLLRIMLTTVKGKRLELPWSFRNSRRDLVSDVSFREDPYCRFFSAGKLYENVVST